jgi:HK97 family phage major capsid protein
MSIPVSERVQAATEADVAAKDSLVEVLKQLEETPDDESLVVQVEELTTKAEKASAHLESMKRAEAALAARAKPVAEVTGTPAIIPNMGIHKSVKTPGELLWKHATAAFIGHVERKHPAQVIEERYADDLRVKETFDYVQKTAVAPAMTTNAPWAGALVREDTRGFIESLEAVSVAAQLTRYANNLTFDGYGSIKMPMENDLPATPTEPAWVGEGGVIPLTSFSYASKTIHPYKLAAVTTMTREIVDRSTPAIEALVERGLRKAYARVLDNALINPAIAAIADVRPASLTNGVTATAPAASTADENVRVDIKNLLTALTSHNLGARPVLIANNQNVLGASMMHNAMGEALYRAELNSGSLFSIPIISSAHVPLNRLIMVDADYIVTAFGNIMFDVSDVATVTEANADTTAPTQANYGAAGAVGAEGGRVAVDGGIRVSGTTGTGSAGYTARSLWQTYSVGIRMVAQTSFARLNDNAVQMIATVDWD